MARKESITFKVNEKELEYAENLADDLGVSISEAMRILLFDSRFLYSDRVDFTDINIPKDELIDEKDSGTNETESKNRIESNNQ